MTDQPIKICFIAPKAYPLFNPQIKSVFGGAEVDLYYIATELAKDKNYQVSFIVADYNQPETETIENVTIIKSLNFKQNPLLGAKKIWHALKNANAQMYMIKTVSPGMFLTALFCRIKRKRFIYRSAHTNDCDGTYLKKHLILGSFYRWFIHTASQVLVQNVTDQENIKRTLNVDSKVIPNAHSIQTPSQNDKDFILWVSRSDNFKRPFLFLNLVKEKPDCKFVMICQKATNDDNYQELVESAKQFSNLEFIRRVDYPEIDCYFQKAKLFVNTSDSEGFPNTFIQACKAATPILSLWVNPDKFLDRYKCGLCAHDSWDKFLQSFDYILKHENFDFFSKNARKYVEENHDISKVIHKYKQLFENIARENKK